MDASTALAPSPERPPGEAPRGGRNLHRFANPGRFLRLSGRVLPWLAVIGLGLTVTGLVWGLFFAPADWQQGDAVRIMYVHVPTAWLASSGYVGLALASSLDPTARPILELLLMMLARPSCRSNIPPKAWGGASTPSK